MFIHSTHSIWMLHTSEIICLFIVTNCCCDITPCKAELSLLFDFVCIFSRKSLWGGRLHKHKEYFSPQCCAYLASIKRNSEAKPKWNVCRIHSAVRPLHKYGSAGLTRTKTFLLPFFDDLRTKKWRPMNYFGMNMSQKSPCLLFEFMAKELVYQTYTRLNLLTKSLWKLKEVLQKETRATFNYWHQSSMLPMI